MTHHEEWPDEPRGRGLLGRMIAPEAGARPTTTALAVGAAGAVAFVASLTMDWQTATIKTNEQAQQASAQNSIELSTGLGSIDSLSLVYVAGMLGLLGLLGTVLNRPDVALRLRMTASGLGVGLLAVVVAIALRLPESVYNTQLLNTIYGGVPSQLNERVTSSYEIGLALGFAAVVLPLVAIWLASGPAARTAVAQSDEARRSWAARHAVEEPRLVELPPYQPVPGVVNDLTVSAEPLDLSVQAEPRYRRVP